MKYFLKKNSLKAGGWMRFKLNILKNRLGFTLFESIVYIFLTTIILIEGISLFTTMYRYYIESQKISIKYNEIQNFYLNLDNISTEGNLDSIVIDSNNITFVKNIKYGNLNKIIKANKGEIFLKYTRGNTVETINTMLSNIDKIEVVSKGNLIYLIIYDKDGKEFIRCI